MVWSRMPRKLPRVPIRTVLCPNPKIVPYWAVSRPGGLPEGCHRGAGRLRVQSSRAVLRCAPPSHAMRWHAVLCCALQALAGVGPLRQALLIAAEELAGCVSDLESQSAPQGALASVRHVLGDAVEAAVQQVVCHLQAVSPVLAAREGWQLSLTHSGGLPVTLLPEQLQVRFFLGHGWVAGWGKSCCEEGVCGTMHVFQV